MSLNDLTLLGSGFVCGAVFTLVLAGLVIGWRVPPRDRHDPVELDHDDE